MVINDDDVLQILNPVRILWHLTNIMFKVNGVCPPHRDPYTRQDKTRQHDDDV